MLTTLPAIETVREPMPSGFGDWMTIWFAQPEMRNPMTDEMVAETVAALEAVREDRTLRGITLRGQGGVFSAGGNLRQFAEDFQTGHDREPILAMSRGAARILDTVATQPQVTVALVEGAAVAGGLGMVCACDLVIAQASAKFALTETMIGLTPAQIAPFVMARLGERTARRLMLTAARFDGDEAFALGLADYTGAEATDLEVHEMAVRGQIANTAPGAIAALKALLRELPGRTREEQIELAAANFADRMVSDEAKEGIASFFEKRRPAWATGPMETAR